MAIHWTNIAAKVTRRLRAPREGRAAARDAALLETILAARERCDAGDPRGGLEMLEAATQAADPASPAGLSLLLERIELCGFRLARSAEALLLCEHLVEVRPDSQQAWVLLGRLLAEAGRSTPAVRAFRAARRIEPDSAETAFEVAKLQRAFGRPALARRFAERALQLGESDAALIELLAQLSLALRDPQACLAYLAITEATHASRGALADMRRRAEAQQRILADGESGGRTGRARHIAIGGEAYSGSTLLGAMLGSVEGCGYIGETRELTSMAPETAAPQFASHCRVCGERCTVLTAEFRHALPRNGVDFYQTIAERMGVGTLVSSDGFGSEYLANDPASDFNLVILYKPVASWLRSNVRWEMQRRGVVGPAARHSLIRECLDHWAATYEGLLNDVPPNGEVIVVNWDGVVRRPAAHFERLLRRLGLEGEPEHIFSHITSSHYIGGNRTPGVREVLKTGRIAFRDSNAPPLQAADQGMIRAHARAMRIAQRLDRRYRWDFAGVAAD